MFCGGTPVTKEHVIPRWISRLLKENIPNEKGTFDISLFHQPPEASDPPRGRQGAELDIQVRRVCATCNNGWMSDMEKAVIPNLKPMILGSPSRRALSPGAQRLLASWAMKLTMMLNLVSVHSYIPEEEYRRFYEQKRPSGGATIVWLSAYMGSKWAGSGSVRPLFVPEGKQKLRPSEPNGYYATIQVHRTLFQLFDYFGPETLTLTRRWDGLVSQIWPHHPVDYVVWPENNFAFSDEALDEFRGWVDWV